MNALRVQRRLRRDLHGFTLVELLVVIAIIAILAGMTVFTLFGVREDARERSTRATITQINEIIMKQVEEYRSRPVPIRIPATMAPEPASAARLLAIRQLMRMELPDRVSDVVDYPVVMTVVSGTPPAPVQFTMSDPSRWLAYRRRAFATLGTNWDTLWTTEHQGAECLYMILAAIRDGDSTGLDAISEDQIGDTDGDKMPEILDEWGRPIAFLRWAPGYRAYPGADLQWGNESVDDDNNGTVDDSSEAGWVGTDDEPSPSDLQSGDAVHAPDYFDLMRVDPRWKDGDFRNDPFVLYPLVFSAGRDQKYGITVDYAPPLAALRYSTSNNDPYFLLDDLGTVDPNDDLYVGKPIGFDDHADNITNHLLD